MSRSAKPRLSVQGNSLPSPYPRASLPPEPVSAPSLVELLRLRAGAWVAQRATEAELTILSCHTSLVEARSRLSQAKLAARLAEATARIAAEGQERELSFQRQVWANPLVVSREIIGADTE